MDSKEFYATREWQELRYRALVLHGSSCLCCGRNYKEDKVKIHVDHIKPRSLRADLELDINNLQVLCEDCNMGKSNKDDTDWRPVKEEPVASIGRSSRTTPIPPRRKIQPNTEE